MKKLLLSFLIVSLSLIQLSAQSPTFINGDQALNFGFGLGTSLYSGGLYKTQIPPLSASYEKAIVDNILEKGVVGVGPYLGFVSYKWEYLNWGWKYSNFILGARGNFHYPIIDNMDTYTGLLLGFNIVSSSEFGTAAWGYDYSSNSSGIVYSWFVGAKYYFNDKLAAMAELGYGISYLNLGIGIKL